MKWLLAAAVTALLAAPAMADQIICAERVRALPVDPAYPRQCVFPEELAGPPAIVRGAPPGSMGGYTDFFIPPPAASYPAAAAPTVTNCVAMTPGAVGCTSW